MRAVRTTALTARKGAAGHRFGDGSNMLCRFPGEVPSGVEEPRAFDAHAGPRGLSAH